MNIDEEFTSDPLNKCWGFVVRDHDGKSVGARAGLLQFPQSAIYTEAEACIQRLTTAMNWGMSRKVIESDCQGLVQALNSNGYNRSPIGVLMRDAKMLAILNFMSASFVLCRRRV
jgi:ribonuclease HI